MGGYVLRYGPSAAFYVFAFRARYKAELRGNPALRELIKLGGGKIVTLLYAAHDPAVNHAVVLRSVLRDAASKKRATS
jgi:uncharacterized protein YeaO (DUF488 family)